ncbi:glycerate kinase [Arthrobacter sp.]|uniref:glycerate kinase n=1 Tax=Arthrobacter sp. TaxID=1667 RepID=UPI003399C422
MEPLDRSIGLPAAEVAARIAAGLRRGWQAITVDAVLMADGGEGTLEAAISAGISRRAATVSGAPGQPLKAGFAVRDSMAVIELAAASGLDVLPGGFKDACGATSLVSES